MPISNKSAQLISLKEASEISGYTPDYIGQLIRKGKLPGKQVYSNVAWMTTAEAVEEYMRNGTAGKEKVMVVRWWEIATRPEILARVHVIATWAVIGTLGLFILFLWYVLAVTIDRTLERTYVQKLQHAEQPL